MNKEKIQCHTYMIDAKDHFGEKVKVDVFKVQKVFVEEQETGFFLMLKIPEGSVFLVSCMDFDYWRYPTLEWAKEERDFWEETLFCLKNGIVNKGFRKDLRRLLVKNKIKNREEWDKLKKEMKKVIVMMDNNIWKNRLMIRRVEEVMIKRLSKIGMGNNAINI